MSIKKETISIVPDISLFAKLGNANYTVSEAISELIDNSIDAREDKVNINIKISKDEVVVEDDGRGMTKEDAVNSIILGKSNKKTGELGHFGMGLKTSCMSLGRKFSVHTTVKGSKDKYFIDFDAEEWEKKNKWDQQINVSNDSSSSESGTVIRISKLKFNQHKNLIDSLLSHLSERFGVFVNNKEVNIKVNNNLVKSSELKLVDGSRKDFVIKLNNGEEVKGWTGILEKGSQEKSGFNLYRYNRLIRAHEKLGYQYHPSKMWVTGEVHLDSVPVTHNKREFITTDSLFVEFFEKFKDILKEVIDKSQNKNKEEQIKDLPKHIKETLKNNLMEALNNFDELKELAFPNEQQLKKDNDGKEQNKEKRDITGDIIDSETKDPTRNQNRTPKKNSLNRAKFITINGQRYKFEFEWANLDDDEKSKEAFLDPSTSTIMVMLNKKYKLLDILSPDILYMIFYISEGIIEVFLKESNQSNDRLVHLRDGIIKRLADVYSDDINLKIKEKDENEVEAYNHLINTKNKEDDLLSENEKKCLSMRLEDGMTLKEIGDHFEFTRERARQIISNALRKINKTGEKLEVNDDMGVEYVSDASSKQLELEIQKIIENTSGAYGISVEDVLGDRRQKGTVLPRHIIMYKLRKELELSFPKIGRIFGKDHTTIMHAFDKIEKMLSEKE
jgi:hypothetical protein